MSIVSGSFISFNLCEYKIVIIYEGVNKSTDRL